MQNSSQYQDDSQSCYEESKIPEIMKSDNFNPKIVEEETAIAIEASLENEQFKSTFKLIDEELDTQIFNGPNSDPRMTLDIKRLK